MLKERQLNVKFFKLNFIDKRLVEEINNNKYKPQEIMKIAESLGISAEEQKEEPKMLTKYGNTHGVDSSMEID